MRWTTAGRAGPPALRDRVEDGERLIEEAGGNLVGVWRGGEDTETLRAFTRDEAEEISGTL